MKAPSNLPTCEHGKIAGTNCKECYHRDELIRVEVKPLADEWWEDRGKRDLNHQLYRAYRMGMKSTTPDPLAEKVIEAAITVHDELAQHLDLYCDMSTSDTRKILDDFYYKLREYQKANNNE